MSKPTPILTFAPKIDPEAPAWLRQHLSLIYQKLGNHTQAMGLLAQNPSGSTTTNRMVVENILAGGGGGGTPSTIGAVNNQSGVTAYATQSGDYGALLVLSDASPVAVTLTTQGPPWFCWVANLGAGTATLTPASGTINGGASYSLTQNSTVVVAFDGTDWWAGADVSGGGGGYSLGGALSNANLVFGPGAGTGPSGLSVTGLDGNHSVGFIVGAAPAANAVVYTLTFTASRGHAVCPVFNQANATYWASFDQIPFATGLAGRYAMYSTATPLSAGQTYLFNVSCP